MLAEFCPPAAPIKFVARCGRLMSQRNVEARLQRQVILLASAHCPDSTTHKTLLDKAAVITVDLPLALHDRQLHAWFSPWRIHIAPPPSSRHLPVSAACKGTPGASSLLPRSCTPCSTSSPRPPTLPPSPTSGADSRPTLACHGGPKDEQKPDAEGQEEGAEEGSS